MKRHYILIVILFVFNTLHAQFNFEYSNEISVKIGSNTLKLPWGGGLNYVQFSDFDYDFDGDLDLFVFDRSSDNIRVFTKELIGSDVQYKLQPTAPDFFPMISVTVQPWWIITMMVKKICFVMELEV